MRYAVAALLGLVLAGDLLAHEKFKIVGSVSALKKEEIAVKAIDGATYEIDFLDTAVVTDKNHKKVDRATLKVGEKVIVLALGHDMFDLEAVQVQLTER
ncbi:MAG TPA: hypothetical protein VNT81_23810 [Vicinamibacterales bacterium]|nr:hypothetical protein [Vicinamibacterales bacterium]